jgi:hypothetical protein
MKIYEAIISIGQSEKIEISHLYAPAAHAAEHPDTDVKILNNAAYYVIRDMAKTTREYLPLDVFKRIPEAMGKLKTSGKINLEVLQEFANAIDGNSRGAKTLYLIMLDEENIDINEVESGSLEKVDPPTEGPYGIYGGYGYESSTESTLTSTQLDTLGVLKTIFGI